jgi:hypothetical protein
MSWNVLQTWEGSHGDQDEKTAHNPFGARREAAARRGADAVRLADHWSDRPRQPRVGGAGDHRLTVHVARSIEKSFEPTKAGAIDTVSGSCVHCGRLDLASEQVLHTWRSTALRGLVNRTEALLLRRIAAIAWTGEIKHSCDARTLRDALHRFPFTTRFFIRFGHVGTLLSSTK